MANRRDMRQRVIALVEAGYGARSAGRLVGAPGKDALLFETVRLDPFLTANEIRAASNFPGSSQTVISKLRNRSIRSRRTAQMEILGEAQAVDRLTFATNRVDFDWRNSPDLNVIENLWAELKKRRIATYAHRRPRNRDELWDEVVDTWEDLAGDQNLLHNLVTFIPDRLTAVIEADGVVEGTKSLMKKFFHVAPKEKVELNLATVVAKELDHLDLSTFSRMFGGDVRGWKVKSERVRHHVGTKFADVVPVAYLHITLPVSLAGRSGTWDPLGKYAIRKVQDKQRGFGIERVTSAACLCG
ncbi:hypothetical protein ANN_06491 [Periplaneta americana]|uniref:Uncharacterized protein n=1 Tax=Periplaneta americana TaxID=6978 RepID=A0ABQ8TFF0_PERAM|nr:hypothetical protein ANN_06491 [Periplaneta americana]